MLRASLLALTALLAGGLHALSAADQPNILWLSAEDHGPHLGCYGDAYADTPHLDKFAARALRYTRAISTAPVCAPARTTIITGMYAPSLGAQHMRSQVAKPDWFRFFPEYLREAGYYCTNNSKTDYNIDHSTKTIWDESSRKAHYQNRKDKQPFFAVFNHTGTHESKIRNRNATTIHDPAQAPVPPYHPDIPETRDNWAQYYDRITSMDKWFAGKLQELEDAGLAEDTIVFFWADHGSGMPRGKRYAGWSGVHVPLIVHIPEKWKHLRPPEYQAGGTSDRLVGFVDFGATMLSLVGIRPPDFQQGSAFLGQHQSKSPAYSFVFRGRMDERPDCSRSVADGRFIYIRNFMPHLPHGQSLSYQLQTQTTRAWRRLFREGKLNEVQAAFWQPKAPEELYDLAKDPHETRNLAHSPEHAAKLTELRNALTSHLKKTHDLALLPEGLFHDRAERAGLTPGDLARKPELYPIDKILPAANLLLDAELTPEKVTPMLRSQEAACRYWATLACLHLGKPVTEKLAAELTKLLDDPSTAVRIAAAQTLTTYPPDHDSGKRALAVLVHCADPTRTSAYHAVAALNALENLPTLPAKTKEVVLKLPTKDPKAPSRVNGYAERMHKLIADPIPDRFPQGNGKKKGK